MCDEDHTKKISVKYVCLKIIYQNTICLRSTCRKVKYRNLLFLHALFKLIHYFCMSRYLLKFRNYDNVMENGNAAATKVLKTEMRLIIEDKLDNMG